MANDEHVALLKQGVAAWNTWRRDIPAVQPNLRKALLRGAYLEVRGEAFSFAQTPGSSAG
jgi:hypothetical protein